MISREDIQSIIEHAVEAPSGENAQPWRFEVSGSRISIFNIPECDQSLYNFKQRGSYIAHGTVIENIAIIAMHVGYRAMIGVFPNENDLKLIATIDFEESPKESSVLYEVISKRTTNRKPYRHESINPAVLMHLGKSATARIEVQFVSDAGTIAQLADVASINDRVMLENRSIHEFFFSHLNWTKEEEYEKRTGFYIETLELPPPAKILFRLFRFWPVMKLFDILGAAKAGAKQNATTYATAAAMGVISIREDTPRNFVEVGRVMQNIWLQATNAGLSLQPLTGVLFFMQRIEEGEKEFSREHADLIRKGYESIRNIFGIKQGRMVMMFRLGYADPPSAHSLKRIPEIIYS